MQMLMKAKSDADTAASAAMMQHNELSAQIEDEKKNSPDLAAHSSGNGATTSNDAANAAAQNVRKARSHEESKATLTLTKAIADDQHNLASLDRRGSNERELSDLYSQWMGLVSARESNV